MASIRDVKRGRYAYDAAERANMSAVVNASLGMFTALEHTGLYVDACKLAELIMWGKSSIGSKDGGIELIYVDVEKGEVDNLYRKLGVIWAKDDMTLSFKINTRREVASVCLTNVGSLLSYVPFSNTEALSDFDYASFFWNCNEREQYNLITGKPKPFQAWKTDEHDKFVVETLPPVAINLLGKWYIFDVPCVSRFEAPKHIISGLKCSSLGENSPVLEVTEVDFTNGSWPVLCDEVQNWDQLIPASIPAEEQINRLCCLARCKHKEPNGIVLHEVNKRGGNVFGRPFIAAWENELVRGHAVNVRVLWGASPAQFWLSTLNCGTPWGKDFLGSLNAESDVSGSLLATGGHVVEAPPLRLGDETVGSSYRGDDDNYELVALSSTRFMRDTSVAYPTTVVSFDAGSHGWSLEMYDSVATNALEVAYFMLGGRFQL